MLIMRSLLRVTSFSSSIRCNRSMAMKVNPRFPNTVPIFPQKSELLGYVDVEKMDMSEWHVIEGPREFLWSDVIHRIDELTGPADGKFPIRHFVKPESVSAALDTYVDEDNHVRFFNPALDSKLLKWRKLFEHAEVVLFFTHTASSLTELNKMRKALKDMHKDTGVSIVPTKVVRIATDYYSQWNHLTPALHGPVAMIYGPASSMKDMLKISTKYSSFLFLCAKFYNQVLSREETIAVSKMPSMEQTQANLVGTIDQVCSGVVRSIDASGGGLARALEQWGEQREKSSSAGAIES